jgi:ABC-type multidrug transport system permease subunit
VHPSPLLLSHTHTLPPVTRPQDAANALLPIYAVTLLLFGGQLMTFTVMPSWLRWYSYLDVLTYAWGALMVSVRAAVRRPCSSP